jgi:MFS transporter, PAT family, beta-lactamase induction signal transducer AmpG
MTSSDSSSVNRFPHPALFAVLMYPFGAVSGYLSVAIEYDLGHNGVALEVIGELIAISFIPNVWKFLWAPVLDITLTPRIWYTSSAIISAIGVLAMGLIPPDNEAIRVMEVVVFLASLAVTFNGMTVDIISAHTSPPSQKGRFGGWMQVGNLAGGGLGGGLALWLSQNLTHRWMSGGVIALTILACPLTLIFIPKIIRATAETAIPVLKRVGEVARESWALARSRAGAMAILVLFLPLGTGAASGLWSAVAGDWSASVDAVALVNGVWSGVLAGVGCLIGGFFCDRMDRKWSYAVFGAMQAACAVAMALAPHTQQMYIVFTLLYSVTAGLTYASFSALTLEVIGVGAAATKYNLLASLSNFPIQYMTLVDGKAHTWWGASGMLFTEAGIGLVGVFIYLIVSRIVLRPRGAPAIA